jgi:hypothetical protein
MVFWGLNNIKGMDVSLHFVCCPVQVAVFEMCISFILDDA